MAILFANNAQTTLAGSITNVATSANLAAGTGALFPNPTGGNYFVMTFVDAATGLTNEIVHVTARSGDAVTILRAQEGTSAKNWLAGDIAANFWTAGQAAACAQRITPSADIRIYAAPTGSDTSGDGSVGNPFLTSQHAFNILLTEYDGAGFNAIIDISAYTSAATAGAGYTIQFTALQPLVGFSSLTVLGNTGTPILVNVTSGNCFESFGSANYAISGVRLQASGSGSTGNGIRCADSASISIGAGVQFGACGQSHIATSGHCEISINANYAINGGAVNHYSQAFGANIFCIGRTVTLSGTPAFSGAFAAISGSGTNLSTNGSTFSGAGTGTRYAGTFNSLIFTGGAGGNAQLPGNVNGSVASGAQIDVA